MNKSTVYTTALQYVSDQDSYPNVIDFSRWKSLAWELREVLELLDAREQNEVLKHVQKHYAHHATLVADTMRNERLHNIYLKLHKDEKNPAGYLVLREKYIKEIFTIPRGSLLLFLEKWIHPTTITIIRSKLQKTSKDIIAKKACEQLNSYETSKLVEDVKKHILSWDMLELQSQMWEISTSKIIKAYNRHKDMIASSYYELFMKHDIDFLMKAGNVVKHKETISTMIFWYDEERHAAGTFNYLKATYDVLVQFLHHVTLTKELQKHALDTITNVLYEIQTQKEAVRISMNSEKDKWEKEKTLPASNGNGRTNKYAPIKTQLKELSKILHNTSNEADVLLWYIKKCYNQQTSASLEYITQCIHLAPDVLTSVLILLEKMNIRVTEYDDIEAAEAAEKKQEKWWRGLTNTLTQRSAQTSMQVPKNKYSELPLWYKTRQANDIFNHYKQKYTFEKNAQADFTTIMTNGISNKVNILEKIIYALEIKDRRFVKNKYQVFNVYAYRIIKYWNEILALCDHNTYDRVRVPRFHIGKK